MTTTDPGFRVRQILAFLAVYIIWGSTYLAIRVAVETLPPFSMAAVRFLVAGGLLLAWCLWRGIPMPTAREWRSAFVIGGLLLLGGNGAVVWAVQYIDSGLAALLVAVEPLIVVLLLWAGGERPKLRAVVGLLIGFVGAALLIAPRVDLAGNADGLLPFLGIVVVLIGALSWARGSLLGRHAPLPKSANMATAAQMLAGGALLGIAGVVAGEPWTFEPAAMSWASVGALAYLIVFGAIIAYNAYVFLLRTTDPSLVSTYAYVNPAIAVFLGWWILDEPVSTSMLVAAGLIIGAVTLVSTAKKQAGGEAAGAAGDTDSVITGAPCEEPCVSTAA